MPTIEEVCSTFGLTDVDLQYTETDFQNLTTYKLFQQHVRPLLSKENPKVPMSKLMMLVAAKWREFSDINPHLQSEAEQTIEAETPKSRGRPSSKEAKQADSEEEEEREEEEHDDEPEKVKKKRGRSKKGSFKKASKVPTLKIKLGKRKRGSSEEDPDASGGNVSERDSDAEFEQMLADAEDPKDDSSKEDDKGAEASSNTETPQSTQDPPVRRKAKTKIGNKSKKKKMKKTTSKFPDGEEVS